MVNIPLIIQAPDIQEALGARTDRVASSVDLFPSICDLFDIETPQGLMGTSMLKTAPNPQDNILAYSEINSDENLSEAYWGKRYKLIQSRFNHNLELYDLEVDPNETADLAIHRPILVMYMRAIAAKWKRNHIDSWVQRGFEKGNMDAETFEYVDELEALGYF